MISPFVSADAQGRLRIRTAGFPLDLLEQRLRILCSMIEDALARGLLLVETDCHNERD